MLRNKLWDAVAMTTKESGVYDLRCLFIPMLLSEIDVPERSWRFTVLVPPKGMKRCKAKAFLNSMAQLSLGRDQIHAAAQKTTVLPLLNLLKKNSAAWLEQLCKSWVSPGTLRFSLSYCPCRERAPGSTPSLAVGAAREKAQYPPTCRQGGAGWQDEV